MADNKASKAKQGKGAARYADAAAALEGGGKPDNKKERASKVRDKRKPAVADASSRGSKCATRGDELVEVDVATTSFASLGGSTATSGGRWVGSLGLERWGKEKALDVELGMRASCTSSFCSASAAVAASATTTLERQRCHVQPGAFSVAPTPGEVDDDGSVGGSTAETLPRPPSLDQGSEWSQSVLVEASLVDDDRYGSKVLVEATPLTPEGRRNQPFLYLLGLLAVLVTVSGTVGALVSRSKSNGAESHLPTVTKAEALATFRSALPRETLAALDDRSTPQSKAFEWLSSWLRSEDVIPGDPEILYRIMRQRFALVTLYHATDGPHWKNQSRWLTKASVCTWYFDAQTQPCQSDQETMVSMGLTDNGLSGSLPPELSLLSSLTELKLESNVDLNGTIPKSIQHLPALSTLSFSGNELSGSLPELNATVAFLDLTGNRFEGSVPDAYGRLSNVESFVVQSNKLNGTVPWELFARWPSASRIDMSDNQFRGGLGSGLLSGLRHLTSLDLSLNRLSGTLSTELGLLTSARSITLWHNGLSGTLPSQLGSLARLTRLDVAANQLIGTVPNELGLLSSLEALYLDKNFLNGTLPSTLLELRSIRTLSVPENQLTGTIPRRIDSLPRLQYLILQSNGLTGSIPTELGLLTGLIELHLESNSLQGSIPSELGSLTGLIELQLASNALEGTIPTELGQLTQLSRLTLHGNPRLTGRVPSELCALVNSYHLDLQVDCDAVRCHCRCTCVNVTLSSTATMASACGRYRE